MLIQTQNAKKHRKVNIDVSKIQQSSWNFTWTKQTEVITLYPRPREVKSNYQWSLEISNFKHLIEGSKSSLDEEKVVKLC